MAIRKIIYLPDPRLRKHSVKIDTFDEKLSALVDDMFETMYDGNGIGLAAPQIGLNIRLAVIDIANQKEAKDQLVMINPTIVERKGEIQSQEGCLSVPGVYDEVKRSEWIKLNAFNQHGELFELEAQGLFGMCIQHEIDHLDGKVFIDLLSPLKRNLARKKLSKFKREEQKQY
jgi:peptide deformylase